MPLRAKPAVRSGDGCKIQRRAPGGRDADGGAGAACLVEGTVDASDKDFRVAVLLDSFVDEATLAARSSARNEKDVNHRYLLLSQ